MKNAVVAKRKDCRLDTDDMDRWKVQLRLTLDREYRRFLKAHEIDYFHQLLKSKLSDQAQEKQGEQVLSINLTGFDDSTFNKLDNFLKTFMDKCPSVDEQNKLHKVLRDLLIELWQKLYSKDPARYCADPYCFFCGVSRQQPRQTISNAAATLPLLAARTPNSTLHNHSMQRLQRQFRPSFTRKQNSGTCSATPLSKREPESDDEYQDAVSAPADFSPSKRPKKEENRSATTHKAVLGLEATN